MLAFLGVSAVVICVPGPDTALTVRNALAGGRRCGVATAAGVAIGQAVWTLATGVGIAELIRASEPAFLLLKWAGAAYLVAIGLQSLWTAIGTSLPGRATLPVGAPEPDRAGSGTPGGRPRATPRRGLGQGLVSNLANPKMAAFFLSLLPQFADPGSGAWGVLGLGLVFCLLTFAWLALYSVAVDRARALLAGSRVRRVLDAVSGGVPFLHVTGRVSYVNGSPDVAVSYTVTNVRQDQMTMPVRLFEAGDLVVAGNDSGTGAFAAGPPREVGAVHPLLLGYDRLLEITPWTHFQEATLSVIQNAVSNPSQAVQGMADTITPTRVDTAAGAQWNFANLAPGVPVVVSALWRFARTSPLDLVATSATQALGRAAVVSVSARNGDGSPDPGRSVRYSIVGANPGSGAVTTDGSGTAAITWTGTKLGTDTLTAFVDRDGNGLRDVNSEPQQTATVVWTPPPPPVPGKSVVAKVVSGQVFIKRPGSGRARQAGAPTKGFVPFTGTANIPVGSQLDTRKGRLALTSASDTAGVKTQSSDFYSGIFQVKQSVPKKKPKKPKALVTDVVMKGQIARSQCAPLKGARAAASKKKKGPKAVLGRLWGNGKGKFRTNGKYSSATVRGTIWLVEDRCEGTLTKVQRGTVQVRDFKRKKTVTVKAGHTYLARAQRATSKAKRRG